MTYFMTDIEADGPCPGLYSMVSFGVVLVRGKLEQTFYSDIIKPLEGAEWVPEALAVSGVTREQHLAGQDPKFVMHKFASWLRKVNEGRPMFISDNNGFDWQFINYYFWLTMKENPFGFSSTNLGSLYKGLEKSAFANFKRLRKTKHTHHPVDDSKGNAEALLYMKNNMDLKIKL